MHNYRRGIVVVLMCETGMTNAEPSEDNSILAVKVGQIAIVENRLDRMQLVGCISIPHYYCQF